ncbi:MAG: hypothetical protein CR996_01000 [Draconibacterium sp.]|nr:MAG: hypothetical protein CR996_01000 [Draconibacterium sp.]PIF06548.1 MAG: hypothetical protein CSA36_00885 [Draconibacterium sp.]
METAPLSEIKKELKFRSVQELQEICLRLARFKKENKELLHFLLFEAMDQQSYINVVKAEIDSQFKNMNRSNIYLAKKTIRKVLKSTNKYIRFTGDKIFQLELRIYFCLQLRKSGIKLHSSRAILNLYQNQVRQIKKIHASLHEDLQYDYAEIIDIL